MVEARRLHSGLEGRPPQCSSSLGRRGRAELYALSALFAVGALTVVTPSAAQTHDEAPVRVRVEYEAPADCPRETSFWAALLDRTSRVKPARHDEPATVVRVTVGASGSGHWGSLLLLEGGAATGRRRVDGASCAEVVEALGLAAALSLDPEALLGPPPPEPEPEPEPEPKPEPEPLGPWRVALGAHAAMDVPVVPFVFGGPDVFIDLEHPRRGPTFGASFGYAASHNDIAGFGLGKATLAGCPARVPLGGTSAFVPCLHFDAGWIHGAGRNLLVDNDVTRSWFALGLGARFQIGLSQRFFLELGGALSAPLVRREFVIDTPPRTLAETPAIVPSGKIGLGIRP